jgi:hypothetical protein
MFSKYPTDEGGLDFYTCVTLIDITKTDAVRHWNPSMDESESDYNLRRNQQRNYQTMLQLISLRSQPVYLSDPVKFINRDLTDLGFGTTFTTETTWAFSFGYEQVDLFLTDSHPFGALLSDMNNVPIILNLMETADITSPMLNTSDSEIINTVIYNHANT